MSVRIGIIGVGVMGADHARTLVSHVPGAELKAIHDASIDRARAIAAETGAGVADDAHAIVRDPAIDAVVVASPDATHRDLTLACLAARKPVLCEKPLAPTAAEARTVIETEIAIGRRLVTTGYMRRFDPAYVEMKTRAADGAFGAPLMFHCVHRNVSAPAWFDGRMAISNSAVHEFDIARWLLADEPATIAVSRPTAGNGAVGAPLFLVMDTAAGRLVTIEVHVNAGYGYDVRGELVCERGTLSLRAPAATEANLALAGGVAYPRDWRPRFADAYRLQLQDFVRSVDAEHPSRGASAFDGLMATVTAEAALAALANGKRTALAPPQTPSLYRD